MLQCAIPDYLTPPPDLPLDRQALSGVDSDDDEEYTPHMHKKKGKPPLPDIEEILDRLQKVVDDRMIKCLKTRHHEEAKIFLLCRATTPAGTPLTSFQSQSHYRDLQECVKDYRILPI